MNEVSQIGVSKPKNPSQTNGIGVVYTKPWVVEIILDLAGYTPDKPLAKLVAVEPSAGDGAFLIGMVRRLVESCKKHRIPLRAATDALRAYEINPEIAVLAIQTLRDELLKHGVNHADAQTLAQKWVLNEDFLQPGLDFPSADFVIGNPPYIRLEEIPEEKARFYRSVYTTMRGRSDIYIPFYEAALGKLRTGGVCAFICADRWLRNNYGETLRALISSQYSVRYIVETHSVQAFEQEVSAYPSITVISREKQGPVTVAKALPGIEFADKDYVVSHIREANSNSVLTAARFNKWFTESEPWTCTTPEGLSLLKSLEKSFLPLESEITGTKVGIGVATGADEVFIVEHIPDVEEERLLPLAMVSDTEEAIANWSGTFLINPWDENGLVDLKTYPRLLRYFKAAQDRLKGRHTAKGKQEVGWHKTIDRVNLALLSQKKLYIADIKGTLRPSLDKGLTYPHHNLYWITSKIWDLRVLGALLMSDVAMFFVNCYGVKMRGGYFRFQAQYLRRIRVPDPELISKADSVKLIRAFETRDLSTINQLAHNIYGIKSLPKFN